MGKECWEGFDNMVKDNSRVGVFLMAPPVAIRLEDASSAGNR